MRKLFMALALSAGMLTTLPACDEFAQSLAGDEFTQCLGIDNANDILTGIIGAGQDQTLCPKYEADYRSFVAEEGKILTVPEVRAMAEQNGDFAMGLVLNADGLKKLFDASVSWAKTVKPEIGMDEINGKNYVTFGFSTSVSGFSGTAIFGVPIEATPKENPDRSSVFVNLRDAKIVRLKANGSSTYSEVNTLLETLIKTLLASYLDRVHIFDIAAWEIGNGDVKLFAGSPKIHVDRATGYKALEFGMYSNLVFSLDAVNIARSMPQDADVGLHIHPDLIRAIIGRMMTEVNSSTNDTYITRDVQLNTSSSTQSSSSGFHVTMAPLNMYPQAKLNACSEEWREYFTFGFRLWSTDSFCGYMDLLAGLKLQISDSKFSIGVGNIHGGYSEGAMSLANGVLNSITTTDFFKSMLDYTNISINFNELTVTDQNSSDGQMRKTAMESDHFQLSVDGSGISLYLNFLDL